MKTSKLKTLLVLMAGLTLVACRPAKKDPPLNYDHVREDAKVDTLQLDAGNPLHTIGAPALWKKSTGKSADGNRVIIGVVGTGIDYKISDLRDSLWMNLGEMGTKKSQNDYDDDGNGVKDDVIGYDFYSGDALPYDWHGHDTFTSSLMGATARSNREIVGVAPNASLLIARYLGPDGRGSGMDGVAALEYAIANGSSIIYFNWPQGGFPQAETGLIIDTIKEAAEKNILVVIPAGNSGNQAVPALITEATKLENVIIVSGLNENGRLSMTTNHGKRIAHIAAPSEGAVGYLPGGTVTRDIKTSSVAAAYVAGAAALISTLPEYGSVEMIKKALMEKVATPRVGTLDVLAQGALSLDKF